MTVFSPDTKITMIDFAKPLAARLAQRKGPAGPYYFHPRGKAGGREPYAGYMAHGAIGGTGSRFRLRTADCEPLGRSQTTGYYTEDDGQGDVMEPRVVLLSHGRFMPAATLGEGMASYVQPFVTTDRRAAECWAWSLAERLAENEREYNREWRAAQDASREHGDLGNVAHHERQHIIRLCAALRAIRRELGAGNVAFLTLRDEVRYQVEERLERRADAIERRQELRAEYADHDGWED